MPSSKKDPENQNYLEDYDEYAIFQYETEVNKFRLSLNALAKRIRNQEDPNIKINDSHITKAIRTLSSPVKYLQQQLILIIVLLASNLCITVKPELFSHFITYCLDKVNKNITISICACMLLTISSIIYSIVLHNKSKKNKNTR